VALDWCRRTPSRRRRRGSSPRRCRRRRTPRRTAQTFAIFRKWVSMIVRLGRRVGFFLGDEGGRPFSRRDGAGLSWRWRGAARRRE
jgi:hypothetical protein